MMFKPLKNVGKTADIKMDFKPISRTGVLLSNANGEAGKDDYIFIVLKRGKVIFRYDVPIIPIMLLNIF